MAELTKEEFGRILSTWIAQRPFPETGHFWSRTGLAAHLGLDDAKTISNWTRGEHWPRQIYLWPLAYAFGFAAQDGFKDGRRLYRALPDWAAELDTLKEACKPKGTRAKPAAGDAPDPAPLAVPPAPPLPPGLAPARNFPRDLPASLPARRAALRLAIAALLGPEALARLPALQLLKAAWPDSALPDPPDEDADTEAVLRLNALGDAVRACNEMDPPWGGLTADIARRLREELTHLARLLSALVWTEEAWRSLPSRHQPPRVQHVHNPQLLLAGISAAQGVMFDLPFDRAAMQHQHPDLIAHWPPPEKWHLACQGMVRAGVGLDRLEQLLQRLGALFGMPLPPSPDHRRKETLLAFQARLGDEIAVRCMRSGRRVFLLSEQFEEPDNAAVAPLHDLAAQLQSRALAYDGRDRGPHVRGSEGMVLSAINHCLTDVAQVPDGPVPH